MIIVVADDFSGAAETAGIAWRFGLKTCIQTTGEVNDPYDVVVIDLDTRSKPVKTSIELTGRCLDVLAEYKPDWIYKKIDSVLRGHVLEELTVMMERLNKKYALVVPANPSAGRIVAHGRYYIHDVPLHVTDFSNDPEFPRWSSDIRLLLGSEKGWEVKLVSSVDALGPEGIYVGEARTVQDLAHWAMRWNDEFIPAGGSEFFLANLTGKKFRPLANKTTVPQAKEGPKLYVLGSISGQSRRILNNINDNRFKICNFPLADTELQNLDHQQAHRWAQSISEAFRESQNVLTFLNGPFAEKRDISAHLPAFTASAVKTVFQLVKIRHLIIEGGTTASAIVRQLGWTHLIPQYEYQSGVVSMFVNENPNISLVVKPGSYPWPGNLPFHDIG
jgi:uncharacterized protein YgbK (DUF1537 family)